MRKKLLSLILVGLGVLVLLAGLASATLFKPESEVSLSTPQMKDSAYVTASAEVLALVDKNVTVQASAPDDQEVTVIIGRTVDIAGWIGDNPSYAVTGASDWESLTVEPVEATQKTTDGTDTATTDPDTSSPSTSASEGTTDDATDPAEESADSDMWTQYYTAKGRVDLDLKGLESGMSLLAISSGTQAPTLTATWERDVTTPLLVPALVAGAALMLAGIAAYFLTPARAKAAVVAPAATPSETPFGAASTDENQAFSSVDSTLSSKPRTKKPSKLASLKRERAATPTNDDSDSVASASDAFKFSPLTSESPLPSGIAVDPIPAPRVGGSHASAVSTHSARSADSATNGHGTSTASPSAVRKALEEPNLDTAALMQLGLTRRQLREMREAKEAAQSGHTAIPTVANPSSANQFRPATPNDSAASASSAGVANTEPATQSLPPATSRTSGSNWRAAWGVRSTAGEGETTSRDSAFEALSQENRGSSPNKAPASAPIGETSTQETVPAWAPTTPEAQPGARSVRQPASWWSNTPHSPAESAANAEVVESHASNAHTTSLESADQRGEGQSTARQQDSQQSTASAGTSSFAPPATNGEVSGSNARKSAQSSEQPTGGAPATRRALYSNYRAEAERLSAQEDWPVPAPQPDAEDDQQDGGRK